MSTAKERYTQYFWEEYEKDPSKPPNRTAISKKMGWKSPNHSGDMPTIRRDLLTAAGFVLIRGRYHKGVFVDELHGFKVGDRTYRESSWASQGEIASIAVAGDRWQPMVRWLYNSYADDGAKTFTQSVTPEQLASLVLPKDLSAESVEGWLAQ